MTDTKPKVEDKSPSGDTAKINGSRPSSRGGRGSRGHRPAHGNVSKVPAIAFTGTCKKELAGKVIIYSESRAAMAAQWIKFESAVYNAAGKVDAALARALMKKEALTLADFLTPNHDYSSEYTDRDSSGNDVVDNKLKALYDKAEEKMVENSVSDYTTYLKNWETFFFRVKAQIDPETTSRFEMSNDWAKINSKSDAGGLMRLIQTVCVHGTDRDYIPERVLNCLTTLLNSKQGKATPSEFSETMISNHQVLCDVLQVNIFGRIPILQEFVIDRYDDFAFRFEDLATQNAATKQLVSDRCDECILGCNMTLRSNKERSDMNTEVHKSLLSKHGDAFAMNTAEAVDQMIGFEAIKRNGPNQTKKKPAGDTSSAVVLVGISDDDKHTGSGFRCYNCGDKGHSQYKCPELSKDERQALYHQYYNTPSDETTGTSVSKAVLFHLGDAFSDDEEEEDDDVVYDEEAFQFCQVTDTDYLEFISDGKAETPDEISGDHIDQEVDRTELIRVLTNVARTQRKTSPIAWVDAVVFKLESVGITTTTLLHLSMPCLNAILREHGQRSFHNVTIKGISTEVEKAMTGDCTIVPDFRRGHA